MLLIIILSIFVLSGLVCCIIGNKYWDQVKHEFLYYHDDDFKEIGTIVFWVSLLILLGMSFISLIMNSDSKGLEAKYQATYEAIVYKMNTVECRDEFGLLNKNMCNEVQIWNETISYNKEMQRNLWVGIFYPNIYDNFETIKLEGIQYREKQ